MGTLRRRGRTVEFVDFECIDGPIRLGERLGVVLDVFFARRRFRRADVILGPFPPRPVAAEGGVEHDLLILEVGIDVAIRSPLESRDGVGPFGGIGGLAQDIPGLLTAGEEPNLDGILGPLHGVGSPFVEIEAVAEGTTLGPAACVGVARGAH